MQPATLDEAVAALSADGGARLLAGGTDLYPGAGAQLAGSLIDVTGIPGLQGLQLGPDGLRIGAATRWAAIAEATLPPACHALQQAARLIGGRQIQNAGTIGGNLCNASPAADGVPPLLALGAEVEVAGPSGLRRMPLSAFLTGARRTALAADEVLSAVLICPCGLVGTSAFEKLGARSHLVISIAMVAVRLVNDGGRASGVAVAVGACSATARRLPQVEAALTGLPLADLSAAVDPSQVAAALDPIDDIRATARFRSVAAYGLIRRAIGRLT